MKNTYSRDDICKDRDCSSWQGYQSRYLHSQTKKPWAQTISSHVKVKKEPLSIFSSCNTLLGFQNGKMVSIFTFANIGMSPFWKHRYHMEKSARWKVMWIVFNFHRNEIYVWKSESHLRATKGCQNDSLLQT